jgi:hypothetical protein
MRCYRCYLFRRGHIAAVEILDAGSDDAVIRQARAVFAKRKNEFDGFEVWDRTRFVYRLPELPPKYAYAGVIPRPLFYRLHLLDESTSVVGLYDFPAESDDDALEVARLAFDACSDCATRFEVWHGARPVASAGATSAVTLAQVVAARQIYAVELEERIRDSKWAVASSKRLLERLAALRPPRGDSIAGGATTDASDNQG